MPIDAPRSRTLWCFEGYLRLVSGPRSGYIRGMPRSRLLTVVAVVLVAACAEPTEPPAPLSADLEGTEEDLTGFIRARVADAKSQPSSGLMRGRLAMAYDANAFKDEAAATYAQADALDRTDFRWSYFHAHVLAAQGDIAGAIDRSTRALALDPDYLPARLWHANWFLESGELDEAQAAFEFVRNASTPGPALDAANVGLARVLLRSDDAAGAIELLEAKLGNSPAPYARALLVRAYRQAGKETDLVTPADAAPMTWPDPKRNEIQSYVRGFSGRLLRAEALIETGETADAIELLESMREERPEDRTVLNNLAVALVTADRSADARRILEAASDQHDNFHLLHFNLAGIYEAWGEVDRAIEHFDRAISLQPGLLAAHERKIALLMERQRFDAALLAVNAARDQGRVHPDILFYAGVIEGTRGEWAAATGHFESVLALAPDHLRAQLFLARTLAESRRFDEAAVALERAAAMGVAEAQLRNARERIDELRASGS